MKRISNGVKMLISGLVAGFLLCFGLWALVLTTSAAELEPPESSAVEVSESTSTEETPESEFVQDEQTEAVVEAPIAPETAAEAVQDAQSEDETGQSIDQSEAEPERPLAEQSDTVREVQTVSETPPTGSGLPEFESLEHVMWWLTALVGLIVGLLVVLAFSGGVKNAI